MEDKMKPCTHTRDTGNGILDAVNPYNGICQECNQLVRLNLCVKDWRYVVRIANVDELVNKKSGLWFRIRWFFHKLFRRSDGR